MQPRQPLELETGNRRGGACSNVGVLSLPLLTQLLSLLLLLRITGVTVVVGENVRNAALHVNGIELHIRGAAFVRALTAVVVVLYSTWLQRIAATGNDVARCSFNKSIVRCFVVVIIIAPPYTLLRLLFRFLIVVH